MLIAGLIFALTYLVVAIGSLPGLRLDRTGAAVVGAAFMMACGVITPAQAYASIDLATLTLLFGMMAVVGQLRLSGFFRWAGAFVVRRAGTPRQLLLGLVFVSGTLSALFVNDTVCLALTPLVLELAAQSRVRATPYLVALATASNIGSVATLTGNPQNMLIGGAAQLSYAGFLRALGPVALVGLALDFAVIAWVYRAELRVPFEARAHPRVRVHRFLLAKSLVAAVAMLALFLAGAQLSMVALAAGAALLVTRRVKTEKVLREINWSLLTFFAGLFVVVAAARQAGLTGALFEAMGAGRAHSLPALAAVAALLSNLVSNVPAVMLFLPLIPSFPDPHKAYTALAMATTLAGNLTLLGSIANLIVAEGARHKSPLHFGEYLKVGVPVTLLTLAVGVLALG